MPPGPEPKNPGKRCSECGRRIRLSFDGTVRTHWLKQRSYDPETREECTGSNKEFVQELRGERITRR
jgi:hypothetical protein